MQRATLSLLLVGAAALAAYIVPRLPAFADRTDPGAPPDPSPMEEVFGPSAGALTLSAALDQDVLLHGADEDRYLVVEVSAPAHATGERPPVHVALVFDTSGSMTEDNRISDARQAARAVVARLEPSDSLALVTFDDQAWVRIPRTPALEPALLRTAIAGLMPGGGTNLYDGLNRGINELARPGIEGVRRVLLLSDGEANMGITDPEAMVALAASRVDDGVTVSALGVGLDFNEDLLAAVADAGGGTWRYGDGQGVLPEIFADEFERMTRVVARETTLELTLGPGVALEEVYGYRAVERSGSAAIFLGDLHAGEARKVVARVRVPDGELGRIPVAEARLRYYDLGEDAGAEARARVDARVSADPDVRAASVNEDARRQVARALAGAGLARSARAWDEGRIEEAREALRTARGEVEDLAGSTDMIPELVEHLETIDTPVSEAERRRAVKHAKEAARAITR